MVIVIQAGLTVIELAGEPWVVGEHPQPCRVGVGLGGAEGVGGVPTPEHLVVRAAGDDPWRVEVVGKDVVDDGGDGIDRDGSHHIGGHCARSAGAELNGGDSVDSGIGF